MAGLEFISPNTELVGWYAAPFPFGKTEFQLRVLSVDEDGSFTGAGSDKQGDFTVQGFVTGDYVEFVKDYLDGSHIGIKYKGKVEGDYVNGEYKFNYKKMFINLDIVEKFCMEIVIKN